VINQETSILESAGFVASAARVQLSGNAARLSNAWVNHLASLFEHRCTKKMGSCSTIDMDTLTTAGYTTNFPQQIVHDTENKNVSGGARVLTPAACFHVYQMLANTTLSEAMTTTMIDCVCARHEGGQWKPPFRLSSFRMMEVVCIGSRDLVEIQKLELEELISTTFESIGLPGRFETATDAFFMGTGRGAQLIQQLKQLKREFQISIDANTTALASVNYHEDYFGSRFAITDCHGEPASSCCLAFGIERLTAAGILTWGPTPDNWPKELRI
jgi:seryl-tRNA synthetase